MNFGGIQWENYGFWGGKREFRRGGVGVGGISEGKPHVFGESSEEFLGIDGFGGKKTGIITGIVPLIFELRFSARPYGKRRPRSRHYGTAGTVGGASPAAALRLVAARGREARAAR